MERGQCFFIAYGWSIALRLSFVINYSMASSTIFQVVHMEQFSPYKLLLKYIVCGCSKNWVYMERPDLSNSLH